MKTKTFVSFSILVLAVLIIAGSCLTGSKSYKKASEEDLYGTWFNEDYIKEPGSMIGAPRSKLIFNNDGTIENYEFLRSDELYEKKRSNWTYTVTDSWVDSEKNSWYKIVVLGDAHDLGTDNRAQYHLLKLSNSNQTLELARYSIDYPTEIDPDNMRYAYRIYYRQ